MSEELSPRDQHYQTLTLQMVERLRPVLSTPMLVFKHKLGEADHPLPEDEMIEIAHEALNLLIREWSANPEESDQASIEKMQAQAQVRTDLTTADLFDKAGGERIFEQVKRVSQVLWYWHHLGQGPVVPGVAGPSGRNLRLALACLIAAHSPKEPA